MCKQIEQTSKRDQTICREKAAWAYAARQWTFTDIWTAYSNPSRAKVAAWDACKKLCKKLHGHDLIISARSSHVFSACFKFVADGRPAYCYITRDYTRYSYAD